MATESFNDLFEVIRPSFGGELLDDFALGSMADLCARLPIGIATFWGMECRLGESAARGDILFEIKRNSPGHLLLAGQSPNALDRLCEKSRIWSNLRGFARDWLDRELWPAKHVRNIWLEFDCAGWKEGDRAAGLIETPSIFWGPDPDTPFSTHAWDSMVEEMSRYHEKIAEARPIRAFVKALPESASLFQLGMMVSRSRPVVRLCVNRISAEEIPGWLDRIGWPGDSAALRKVLNTFAPLHQNVAVGLDLTPDGLREKLGLEFYQKWGEFDSAPWTPCMDRLVESGLCLPGKRDELLAYPRQFDNPKETGPHEKGIDYPVIYQDIHHLKLTLADGGLQEAKAYIGVYRPGIDFKRFLSKSPRDDGESPEFACLIP